MCADTKLQITTVMCSVTVHNVRRYKVTKHNCHVQYIVNSIIIKLKKLMGKSLSTTYVGKIKDNRRHDNW